VIDVAAIVRAMLADPAAREAVTAFEQRVAARVVELLDERDRDRLLTQAELAALLGVSPAALSMRLRRSGGAELLALSLQPDGPTGRRAWRRSEVARWLDQRRAPALRASHGGTK
jgi:hypothetical protein